MKGCITKGKIFHGGKCNMTPTSRWHCRQLSQSRCQATIEDWINLFAACTTAETPNALQWAGQPHKIAPYHGGSQPPTNTRFLGPTWVSTTNSISLSSAAFAGLTNPTNRQTDTHTHRPCYSTCSNRPYL